MGCTGSAQVAAAGAMEAKRNFFGAYELGDKLGRGLFAQVRTATCRKTGGTVAVKILDLRKPDARGLSTASQKKAEKEANVWLKAGRHPNIVGLKDAFSESGACFFVMEFCERNFLEHLRSGAGAGLLHELSLGQTLYQGLSGLAHLHQRGVVHRDVKPDNFVAHGPRVKLCDFGLGAVMGEQEDITGVVGYAPFMAPEMLKAEYYGPAVDLWSLGVTAYVLMFGTYPYMPVFFNDTEMKNAIRTGDKSPTFKPSSRVRGPPPQYSEQATAFVRRLLHRKPHKRGCAFETLQHPYLQESKRAEARKELPCLLPVLDCAVSTGAFSKRRVDAIDPELDPLIRSLHSSHQRSVYQKHRSRTMNFASASSTSSDSSSIEEEPEESPHLPESLVSAREAEEGPALQYQLRPCGLDAMTRFALPSHQTEHPSRGFAALEAPAASLSL